MSRYWRRRGRRHVSLGAGAVLAVAGGVSLLPSDDTIWKVSVCTGWGAVVLVALTLVLGPLHVLRRRPIPVSFDSRRDVGIWAAVLGVVHSAVGLLVHFRGRPWTYFVWPADRGALIPLRHDLFGAAAWSGLAATILIVVLGALSNDRALRRLGTGRWKTLQRTNYVLFTLVAAHGFAFQVLEKRVLGLVVVLAGLTAVTVGVQWWGFSARRRGVRHGPAEPGAGGRWR